MASACAATKFTRAGYEEASHKVLKKEGSAELRHYSELQLVETTMASDQDNGFMRLFRYIDGGNDKQQKNSHDDSRFHYQKKWGIYYGFCPSRQIQ